MASAGSSFDFASDDVLCSFDEVVNHDLSNENKSVEPEKDLQDSGIGRELVCVYRDEDECPKEEIMDVVEKCMKKYTDSLIQHFEGINGRLTQLEIQCYKLERTMTEFRADSIRDQGEVNTKLKAVVKQLQEVHRSIQIVRDKQELAETQSELTKLQVAPKESNSPTQSQKSDMSSLSSASDPKQPINTSEIPNNSHLALALPHQFIHSHDQQHYIVNQSTPFLSRQSQPSQPEPHYIQARPQIQVPEQHGPQIPNPVQYQPFVLANPTHHHVSNQTMHQSFTNSNPNYVQVQSIPQIPNQQPLSTPHPNPTFVYMQPKTQAVNQPQPPPQTLIIRAQTPPMYPTTFAYGAPGSISVPNQSQLQGHSTVYSSIDGNRVQTYLHPNNISGMQNPQMHVRDSSRFQQTMQVHPYADIIEKATNIGYSREQVVVAINEMVDGGQTVDFNSLLDKLDSSFRAWLE